MKADISYEPISESHLLLRFGDSIDARHLSTIQAALATAETVFGQALTDVTPAYTSLLIEFDCLQFSPAQAMHAMKAAMAAQEAKSDKTTLIPRSIDIPIYYHPDVGWDLPRLSQQSGLSWQEIAQQHQHTELQVYAMGFAPGFAFMGQLPQSLHSERKASPRTYVPAGSLAIADRQSAIYPQASPGGWNIIGRCPLPLFDSQKQPPNLLQVGDKINFIAITREEFIQAGGQIERET